MRRVDDIRAAIEAGGPSDDHTMRRMALRATSRVADPAKAADLHEQFTETLGFLMTARKLHAEEAEHRQDVDELLDEIAAASRPQ